jgi:ABC-2 type transport system ATP-binding protein
LTVQELIRKLPDRGEAVGGSVGTLARDIPAPPPAAAPTETALRVADLSKSFRSGFLRRRLRGIEGVSFTVRAGEVFALLGHNGAGKTTTINCILDLVHPDGGQVKIFGTDFRRCESRLRVGYLPERPYFFEHLSGRELLRFYADLLDVPAAARERRIDEVLDRVGMTADAGRRLRKFSKGMLQRIGLAQALLGDPDLLILDEPMSGLDPMGRREVRELLLELKSRGKTIILSSHIVPDVEMLADSVAVLREGRVALTRDLVKDRLHHAYGVRLGCAPGRLAGASLPAWVNGAVRAGGQQTTWVEARDAAQLRELLAACHALDVSVETVETRAAGLEDVYMAAHTEVDAR